MILSHNGFLSDLKRCFGGGGGSQQQQAPAIAPPPPMAPLPTPTPSEISPQSANDSRRKRLDQMRYGLASTITTSARGLTGSGSNLTAQNQAGKLKTGV